MKILEINLAKTWRGGERQTLYTSQGLRELGHEIVIACYPGSNLYHKATDAGFKTEVFSTPREFLFWLIGNGKKFDILHCQGSKELTWAVMTKIFHKSKVVLTRRVNFKPKGWLTRYKYRRADKVVAISEAIKNTITGFGINGVSVIPAIYVKSTADAQAIETLRKTFNIGERKIIATAAAFTTEKDPFTMLSAIADLYKKRKDFVFLHFGDGELKQTLQEKIKQLGIQEVYKLTGHYANIERLFPAFRLFMMSSTEEGLGSSVLDAFYHRVPVVSTNAGGLADLLSNGRGKLCPVGDDICLSNAADKTLNTLADQTMKQQVDAAYDHLIKHHELEFCSHMYHQLFMQLSKDKTAR